MEPRIETPDENISVQSGQGFQLGSWHHHILVACNGETIMVYPIQGVGYANELEIFSRDSLELTVEKFSCLPADGTVAKPEAEASLLDVKHFQKPQIKNFRSKPENFK